MRNFKSYFFSLMSFLIMVVSTLILTVSSFAAPPTTLIWDFNEDASYYAIYAKADSAVDYSLVVTTKSGTETFVELMGILYNGSLLKPGINYTFVVKAFNECGNSSDFSDPLAFMIPVPSTVNNVTIDKSVLTWAAVEGATSYRITFTSSTGAVKTYTVTSAELMYNICENTDLINGTTYDVTVSSLNDSGVWGAESVSVKYTRRLVRPPSNVKIGYTPR